MALNAVKGSTIKVSNAFLVLTEEADVMRRKEKVQRRIERENRRKEKELEYRQKFCESLLQGPTLQSQGISWADFSDDDDDFFYDSTELQKKSKEIDGDESDDTESIPEPAEG